MCAGAWVGRVGAEEGGLSVGAIVALSALDHGLASHSWACGRGVQVVAGDPRRRARRCWCAGVEMTGLLGGEGATGVITWEGSGRRATPACRSRALESSAGGLEVACILG